VSAAPAIGSALLWLEVGGDKWEIQIPLLDAGTAAG